MVAKKRRKKKKEKLNGLDDGQRAFIENQVRLLGSMKRVRQVYRMDDTVSAYALMIALTVYGDGWPLGGIVE